MKIEGISGCLASAVVAGMLAAASAGCSTPNVAHDLHAVATSPEHVAFCSVTRNYREYVNRPITFVARVESDGIHGIVLVDPSCKDGMRVDVATAHPRLDLLDQALMTGNPGTLDKVVTAIWTGTIDRSGRLVVEAVDDVSVFAIDRQPLRDRVL
jgi:hypothetical protein